MYSEGKFGAFIVSWRQLQYEFFAMVNWVRNTWEKEDYNSIDFV